MRHTHTPDDSRRPHHAISFITTIDFTYPDMSLASDNSTLNIPYATFNTCNSDTTYCDPPIDNSTLAGRLLVGGTFFLFGGSGLALNILIAAAMYRAGLLGSGPRAHRCSSW